MRVWDLPDVHNVNGKWYDELGLPISGYEAHRLFEEHQLRPVGRTEDIAGDEWAGALTVFYPMDLKPSRYDKDPHLFLTYVRYTERRFGRAPRVILSFNDFSTNRTAALAAHDRAETFVRNAVRRNRQWWRRIHLPWGLVLLLLALGAVQWFVNLAYVVATALGWRGKP